MAEKQDLNIEVVPVGAPTAAVRQPDDAISENPRLHPKVKAWLLLFLHGSICIVIALSVALAINGYEALDPSVPRHVHKGLILRVSDITTLVSAALVVVKLFVSSWSTLMVWACGRFLLNRVQNRATSSQVSFMMRWKLPPWIVNPLSISASSHNWIISVGLLLVIVQAFIGPILSGSVNWIAAVVPSTNVTTVKAVDPAANFDNWYWYNAQGSFDKRAYLKQAAGYASLVWADSSGVSANGTSLTGNGCRSVINDSGLPINSTLANAVMPCINIHGINWYKSASDVSKSQSDPIYKSDSLSVVNDAPFSYYRQGAAVVFDPNLPYNGSQNTKVRPAPTVFLGNDAHNTKTIGLLVKRQANTDPPCSNLSPTSFGDVNALNYYLLQAANTADQNCFLVGAINFTAGVTTSKESRYISHRVVEDQTPIEHVNFQPDPWVQEAIWLLPDLMTMISVMNSSQMPTYDNVNGYVDLLVRQAYLSAWDMLHHSFDMTGPVYKATSVEPRLKAQVSFARVYAWLAICMLMPFSGVFLLTRVLRTEDLNMPRELNKENRDAAKEELTGLGKDEVLDIIKGASKDLAAEVLKN